MTDREISEKLDQLATLLEEIAKGDDYYSPESLLDIANELHYLSNEKYTPTIGWGEIKKQVTKSTSSNKKRYFDQSTGKELPF